MCFYGSSLRPYSHWNWDGDEVIHDTAIKAMRYIPGTTKRYAVDIREFLISEDNVIVKRCIEDMLKKLPQQKQRYFFSNEPGSFDYRVEIITDYIRKKFTFSKSRKNFDAWLFPDETITAQKGDCEDISFLLASLLLASGISDYFIRVALGELIRNKKESHSHCWVMYKNERGDWMLLDPLVYHRGNEFDGNIKKILSLRRKSNLRHVEYVPFFVFNNRHLWKIKHYRKSLVSHLSSRRFWDNYNPGFHAHTHYNILLQALYKKNLFSSWQIDQLNHVSLNIDYPHRYHPYDHMDNGFIEEGWNRVYNRLQSPELLEFGIACHAVADFYSHSSYAEFGPQNSNNSLRLFDMSTLSSLKVSYHDGVFDFNRFSKNSNKCVDRNSSIAFWEKKKIISGRIGQPGETAYGITDHIYPYPDNLTIESDLALRGCLPHHNEIAVDSDSPSSDHILYDKEENYTGQFYYRVDAAIRHIEMLGREWKTRHSK